MLGPKLSGRNSSGAGESGCLLFIPGAALSVRTFLALAEGRAAVQITLGGEEGTGGALFRRGAGAGVSGWTLPVLLLVL